RCRCDAEGGAVARVGEGRRRRGGAGDRPAEARGLPARARAFEGRRVMDPRKFRSPGLRPKPAKDKAEPAPERVAAFRTGLSAESRAAALLVAKGFRIIARRWKSPVGEIDIVARRRTLLVFVEVKARHDLDEAAESVTMRQRSRIAAAAEAYIATYPDPHRNALRRDPGRARQDAAAHPGRVRDLSLKR